MKKLKKETWYENIYARIAPILTMNRNSKDSPDSRIIESDAVSSVVALMLLLAVVATFISLYSTSYIPGLKEQSEITQIATVKESFIKFSGDVEHIVMEKTPASCGNMIPLGAGDILFSPEKSSGTLTVTDCGTMVEIHAGSGNSTAVSGMVNVAFRPSYTFWEEQGYTWQYGYINVTKNEKEIPLTEFAMDDVLADDKFSTFAESFVTFEDKGDFNVSSGKKELSSLKIDMVNIIPGSNSFISGNNPTNLGILADVREAEPVTTHHLEFNYTNSTDMPVMSAFSTHLADKIRSELKTLAKNYDTVQSVTEKRGMNGHDTTTFNIDEACPVEVIIRQVNISVSVS
ncbi:hypothetical protein [Methanogenium cariaci]|jgi:hypothetical protein